METQGLEIKTKKCSKCGRELPVTEFYVKSDAPDGLQYWYDSKTGEKRNSWRITVTSFEYGGARNAGEAANGTTRNEDINGEDKEDDLPC